MEIIFLGTGAGMPSKQRNTSSLVVNLAAEDAGYWMFDCGEATQHQLLYTTLKPRKINKIFISHLHGDHLFGLPGFLGSRSFLGGDEPLTIYGPSGLQEWVTDTLRLTKTHLTYPITFYELHEGVIFETDHFVVHAKELQHVIPSFGFRIEQKPLPGKLLIERVIAAGVPKGPLLKRLKNGEDVVLEDGRVIKSSEVTGIKQEGFSIVVLGDTSFCQAAIDLAKEATILVHEATFDASMDAIAKSYGHSTIMDAARVAKEANVQSLIVNHLSARFLQNDYTRLQAEGTAVFQPIYIAHDFSKFSWKDGQIAVSSALKE